jgi:DNA-binding protein HU-beta
MNKAELIEKIAEVTDSKKQAQTVLEHTVDSIKKALKKKDDVAIAGFGSFKVKKTKARMGRNPKTGESIKIPAKKKVVFKPAKDVKEMF